MQTQQKITVRQTLKENNVQQNAIYSRNNVAFFTSSLHKLSRITDIVKCYLFELYKMSGVVLYDNNSRRARHIKASH